MIAAAVDGTLLAASAAAARLLGYRSPAALIATAGHVGAVFVPPRARETVRLFGDEWGISDFRFDAALRHRAGRQIAATVTVRLLPDARSPVGGAEIVLVPKRGRRARRRRRPG